MEYVVTCLGVYATAKSSRQDLQSGIATPSTFGKISLCSVVLGLSAVGAVASPPFGWI